MLRQLARAVCGQVRQQASRSVSSTAAVSGGGGPGNFLHSDTPDNNENTPFEFNAENKVSQKFIIRVLKGVVFTFTT